MQCSLQSVESKHLQEKIARAHHLASLDIRKSLAMALHTRLGRRSALRQLPADVVKRIADKSSPLNCMVHVSI
jgi:glucose-6-phosphate-specific signal transduction histidine kinase